MSRSADVPLPSYETATSRDPIPLVVPYIRRDDIFNCSIVSKSWNQAFEDRLWGEPANFWELGERNALAGFLKFIHILPVVRAKPRSIVHTLSLERVHATIYTRLPATWIAELISLLPNLQNLAVAGFPFFDHSSLMVLATNGGTHGTHPSSPPPAIAAAAAASQHRHIRYLDISSLTNTTPPSLVQLLSGVAENVEFLDLSHTNGVNHPSTLLAIGGKLKSLRSLKLRGLKLTDVGLVVLCRAVGVRLKRLDVSSNLLTDRAVQVLLDWCVMPPEYVCGSGGSVEGEAERDEDDGNDYQSQRFRHDELLEEDEDSEDPCFGLSGGWMTAVKAFRRRLKDASTNNVLPPDIDGRQLPPRETGLTSLNIADNDITISGVISLIKSERLESLDCGAIKHNSPSGSSNSGSGGAKQAAQVTRLIPILTQYAFKHLQNLRINYQIVCGHGKFGSKGLEKQTGGAGLHSPSHMMLVPSSLPRLRHLALVGMPLETSDETIVENLLNFLDSIPPLPPHEASTYHNTRGRRRRHHTVLPRCITLEFNSSEGSDGDGNSKEDTGMYGSSAADDDTSAFHAASSNDFSFFDESYRTDAAEMFGGDEGSGGKWYNTETSQKQKTTTTTTTTTMKDNSDIITYNGVNIADRIREWRQKGSNDGGGNSSGQWEGEIRLVRDFGGKERSVDGEKWGLIIESV